MIYRIIGAVLAFTGLLVLAKFELNVIGLILIFVGFYLAMKKGMKPV